MTYAVKEVFYTLQGEGAQSGRAAVFCRFVGCNLWSGRESDRPTAVCKFCDTDFLGTDGPDGGTFQDASALAQKIEDTWASNSALGKRFVVLTGGEPLLQLDKPLIDELHSRQFKVALETNGTIQAPEGIDWICVSPKAGTKLTQREGDELKLVFPQTDLQPENCIDLVFRHFFLQPMDGPHKERNTENAVRYCLQNPQWRLSLQTHKLIGLR
jgi:7-carboxy-7-deazaguanine synthase (Cx14CxxC type)